MKRLFFFLILLIILSACDGNTIIIVTPTPIALLPTYTPLPTLTPFPTLTPEPSETPSLTPTFIPTDTPLPTLAPTETPLPALVLYITSGQAVHWYCLFDASFRTTCHSSYLEISGAPYAPCMLDTGLLIGCSGQPPSGYHSTGTLSLQSYVVYFLRR